MEQQAPDAAVDAARREEIRESRRAALRTALNLLTAFIAFLTVAFLVVRQEVEPQRGSVTIGTGSVAGLYYPLGGAIARLVNRQAEQYGFRVVVESTQGSLENLEAVLSGEMELGIVQADLEYEAVHGVGEWYVKGPQADLRAICTLHKEMVTLLALDESGIETPADLRGHRVGVGARGSGQFKNANDVLAAHGLDRKVDIEAVEAPIIESIEMLKSGQLDALFYTVGHPDTLVAEVLRGTRPAHFVPITAVGELLAASPFLRVAEIPTALYASSRQDPVPTVATVAVLVASRTLEDKYVFAVARNLFENLDEFKTLHPAFALFERAGMLEGFSAPVHAGALRYYKQTGEAVSVQEAQRAMSRKAADATVTDADADSANSDGSK